jgi:hypothetical protein
MKRFLLWVTAITMTLAMTGCSTIIFSTDNASSSVEYTEWHHNVAYSLYEISEPVNLERYCDDEWSEVVVEKDLVTAIAGGVDEAVTAFVGGIDVWDPWAVTVRCAR